MIVSFLLALLVALGGSVHAVRHAQPHDVLGGPVGVHDVLGGPVGVHDVLGGPVGSPHP